MFAIALLLTILAVYILDSFTDALVAIVMISLYGIMKLIDLDVKLPDNFWSSKK